MPKDSRKKRFANRYAPYAVVSKKKKSNRLYTAKRPAVVLGGIQRPVFGFPSELVTKVRYCDVYTLTSTSGSISKEVWRMNSINDPDYTGVGHQAMYHDQLSALYSHYVVLGSKLTCKFSPICNTITTTQPSGPMLIGLLAENNSTTSSTLSTLMENSNGYHTYLNLAEGGNNVKQLSVTYSPRKDLGLSPDDDTVSADFGANPSTTWYATAWMSETGLASPSSVNVAVTIEFTIRCSRLQDIAGS